MKLKAEQIFSKGLKIKEDKTNTLVKLLIEFVNRAHENDIMPDKKELSAYLGVSIGTVQNAYRILEDKGLVHSKQRIGTVITSKEFNKQTSKRDVCINMIKQYMKQNKIEQIEKLPSTRVLANTLNMSQNTVAMAINSIKTGVESLSDKNETLVEKTAKKLEAYIKQNCKIGDNIPSLNQLSKDYKVSIKTVHDAVKMLCEKKILSAHRGQYGTTVINLSAQTHARKEDMIFAPAKDAEFYYYEKVQSYLKKLIMNNYNVVGAKLPSLEELSKTLDINQNTIRRALKYLEEDGYVTFLRGRYGGTFVTNTIDSYQWVIVNPQYVAEYN